MVDWKQYSIFLRVIGKIKSICETMESDYKLEELKAVFKDKVCTIEKHSNVLEITFENEKDAKWFESVFLELEKEKIACCLMPIRPKDAPPKFIFNLKDVDGFIKIINEKYIPDKN